MPRARRKAQKPERFRSLLGGYRSFEMRAGRSGRGQELEPGAQAKHGERMDLEHARFANAERSSDFFHGEFFVVVKRENALFFCRQFGDGLLKQVFRLRAEALEERCFLGLGWDAVGEIFFFAIARKLDLQAAEFEAVEFGEQGLQLAKVDTHPVGDFIFIRRASELAGKLGAGGFDEAAFATQVARAPVEFAETVKDSAPDAELGVRTELHVLGQIELVEGVDESEDAGIDQVFEGHVARQPIVNAAGDVADMGKLFHEHALAFGVGVDILIGVGEMFGHEVDLLSFVKLSLIIRRWSFGVWLRLWHLRLLAFGSCCLLPPLLSSFLVIALLSSHRN